MTVFVVSAPSGAGKTTLNRRLLKECAQLEMSISHTTRSPRKGEKEGDHYHFVSRNDFEAMIQRKAFIEWAEVHGNL
jgi:guanylate kinase